MSDDLSSDLISLYRSAATEEPDARLDAAILKATRRKPWRRAGLLLASALMAILAVTVATTSLMSQKPPPGHGGAAAQREWEQRQVRLFLINAGPSAIGERVGLDDEPAMMIDAGYAPGATP